MAKYSSVVGDPYGRLACAQLRVAQVSPDRDVTAIPVGPATGKAFAEKQGSARYRELFTVQGSGLRVQA